MKKNLLIEALSALIRHSLTAAGPVGVAVTDDWTYTTAALLATAVGYGWSIARKYIREKRANG